MITDNTNEFWANVAKRGDYREYILPGRTKADFWDEGRRQAEELQPLIKPGDTVLEFGCGVGRVLSFVNAGRRIGVDASKGFLDCIEAAGDSIETVLSDGLSIDLPDQTADFIYSLMVFQHTPKDRHPAMIAELFRVLKPGGKIIIQFPRAESGYYKESSFVNVYSKKQMSALTLGFVAWTVRLNPDKAGTTRVKSWDLHAYADGKKGDREWLLTIEK